jgi:hypothetical protein
VAETSEIRKFYGHVARRKSRGLHARRGSMGLKLGAQLSLNYPDIEN